MVIVQTEELGPCRKRLRIEVSADQVTQVRKEIVQQFSRAARLPGFRPGKAPTLLVEKQFQKEIDDELQKALVTRALREGIQKQQIDVVRVLGTEEVRYLDGLSFSFAALVDCAPVFALPDYSKTTLPRTETEVSKEEIDQALGKLLEARATFTDAGNRPLAEGDYAVVHYEGTIEGRPVKELYPAAGILAGAQDQWLLVKPGVFVPGFPEAILGMEVGQTRTFSVLFPEDWFFEPLRGKAVEYSVTLSAIKERHVPSLSDALAKEIAGTDQSGLLSMVQSAVETEKKRTARQAQSNHILNTLLRSVEFPLPESLVNEETENAVREIIAENQERGVPFATLEEKKNEIFSNARRLAVQRVKLRFLIDRIAKNESIAVTDEQLSGAVASLARRQNLPPRQFVQRISRESLESLKRQLLLEKVMDFLIEKAKVASV
ncbi:Trigger factor [Methylacidimicrobium cyclopophantes]|uniref:Trigger factor n=1 Tax=Methylacidimicrobium cyclopophantes TaxID=1041766 RepID=A0A5E6MKL9_9BACT|nr:trigger factor [Methylacidimicrobium cyclopophantes]VVM08529.1 Trigger factor [Methylacidimicrobium cyclopophantes]